MSFCRRLFYEYVQFPNQNPSVYHKDGDVWLGFRDNRKWLEVYNLPPYSPEYNAAEPLWKYTRKAGTHDRYFESETEIIEMLNRVFKSIRNYSGTKWQRHIGLQKHKKSFSFFFSLCAFATLYLPE
ncbi:MAG TPA: hypothetical protein ENH01_02840 [Nitrospirae bacterium]|nr:hypothetical protein [Nitrospirota bacterium]